MGDKELVGRKRVVEDDEVTEGDPDLRMSKGDSYILRDKQLFDTESKIQVRKKPSLNNDIPDLKMSKKGTGKAGGPESGEKLNKIHED